MFLSVGASTEAKALHVSSVGSVSTRHAVVCVFLAFLKITISPLNETLLDVGHSHNFATAFLRNLRCSAVMSTNVWVC